MIMGAYDARMSRISVVGVPSSAGSYAAGQDQAPGALRSAGLVEALVAAGREKCATTGICRCRCGVLTGITRLLRTWIR